MNTWIYKGKKKSDTYLYIGQQGRFDNVPHVLLDMLGELNFVLEVELTPDRKLAQADVKEVISQILEKGYFLQLPPGDRIGDRAPEKLC